MDFTFIFIAILLQISVYSTNGLILEARFNMKGIKGTISFDQAAVGGSTTVTYNLSGLDSQKTWVIHEFRTIYDTPTKCTAATIGVQKGSLTGTIPASGTGTQTIQASSLNDLSSYTGTSIMFDGTCATLEQVGEHITAFARLPSTIAGLVTFRQAVSQGSVTTILTDLFPVTGTSSISVRTLNWKIHSGTVPSDSVNGAPTTPENRCTGIGAIYNPSSTSGTCNSANQGNCPVGDLSSKVGKVHIATTKGTTKGYMDRNLPLNGSSSIIGKTLAIYDDNDRIISCANIIKYDRKTASVTISRDGVKGYVEFTQNSPYDPTSIHVNLQGLRQLAGGYHIHEWPVPYQMTKNEKMCSNDQVSGHFNPFGISVWPDPGVGTNDQYEIGDISSKFGILGNMTRKDTTYIDWNLPMFGVNSIVGRSLVIHKDDPTASRWVCGNIEYSVSVPMTVAAVTLVYPVIGRVEFRQPKSSWYADTQVYVELNYNDGTTNSSTGHKWHIHANRTGSDVLVPQADGRCNSAAGHYNPFQVDTSGSGNYQSDCKPGNQLRCQLGDLAGKHGTVGIRTTSGGMQRAFFTDIDLPLSGPNSLLKYSLVVHDEDGRLACGDIYEIPERVAKVIKWSKMTASSVTGYFEMKSFAPGFLSGNTGVKVDIRNLASEASGFHVHEYPVPSGSSAPCSNSAVGGHFNPFSVDVAASPTPGTGTDDEYEIGDMSGKYGDPMASNNNINQHYIDTSLPLRGPLSIVGRSIVIHKTANNARWVCGNITEDITKSKAKLFEAVASFNVGEIRGQIHLSQYLYPDGGMSDTEILMNLKYESDNNKITTAHNWHVHEKTVTTDATSGCVSPGGHYNPFHADMGVQYYVECSPSNPLRCELGDQSSKVGTYDIGGGHRFFTDVYLPLNGKYSVVGTKSFVVHSQNKGQARIACANIMPVGGVSLEMKFPKPKNAFDRTHMAMTLASMLHTDPYNVVAEKMLEDSSCTTAKVTLLGYNRESLKQDMDHHMKQNDPSMGIYAPGSCVVSSAVSLYISIITITVALVLQKVL